MATHAYGRSAGVVRAWAGGLMLAAGVAGALPAADSATAAGAGPGAGSPDPAVRIAAALVQERAHAAASVGDLIVAGQLEALARGLLDRSISLADAAAVMVIAGEAHHGALPAAAPSPQARAAASHVADLIDGDPDPSRAAPAPRAPLPDPDAGLAPPPAVPAPPPAAVTPPVAVTAAPPATATPEARLAPPGPPTSIGASATAAAHTIHTKVYAVNLGHDGKVMTAIIGAGGKNGVLVHDRFVITRGPRTIAQVVVVKINDAEALSFTEVVPGSMPDPNDDVREGDEATSWP
jgi:hypothetical protein